MGLGGGGEWEPLCLFVLRCGPLTTGNPSLALFLEGPNYYRNKTIYKLKEPFSRSDTPLAKWPVGGRFNGVLWQYCHTIIKLIPNHTALDIMNNC